MGLQHTNMYYTIWTVTEPQSSAQGVPTPLPRWNKDPKSHPFHCNWDKSELTEPSPLTPHVPGGESVPKLPQNLRARILTKSRLASASHCEIISNVTWTKIPRCLYKGTHTGHISGPQCCSKNRHSFIYRTTCEASTSGNHEGACPRPQFTRARPGLETESLRPPRSPDSIRFASQPPLHKPRYSTVNSVAEPPLPLKAY